MRFLMRLIARINRWTTKNKKNNSRITATCGYLHDQGLGE